MVTAPLGLRQGFWGFRRAPFGFRRGFELVFICFSLAFLAWFGFLKASPALEALKCPKVNK